MLDAETKRRIDSCRDILVGKVPDPKSQVEQITIALIYKFMDDMDAEAIATMPKNPGVPELFRDIFKNAYLPYRDPETLKSFLKEINYFTYDHSERLGDAGQFRTPRHIIDFMVAVMDPKKNETILDPACGTAGFLISAWKHILASNTRVPTKRSENDSATHNNDEGQKGNLRTSDERAHCRQHPRLRHLARHSAPEPGRFVPARL